VKILNRELLLIIARMIKLGLMCIENYSDSSDALFSLIEAVRLCYRETEKPTRRGRRPVFSELSFLLLAVVAVVTKTYSDSELHRLLQKDSRLPGVFRFSESAASNLDSAPLEISLK